MTDIRFTDLTLSDPLLAALLEMGYETPTPVQASAIPMASAGRDLMVQSQTGTGKTAAFGIPLIEGLEPDKGVRGLILCPTRELAKQVADELALLGKFKQIRSVAVYGGASLDKQVAEMRFAQIVVGTPGRVLDHLKRKNVSFKGVRALVLDEADEMLSMGFAQELEQIMRYVPADRQTLLFSATIPPDVKRYAKRYMKEPEFLSLIEENVAADDVAHQYFMVSGVGRSRDLVRVISLEEPDSAIIFTNTRKDCEVVARALKRAGYDAEYLNSDLSQRERDRVMKRTKAKELRFLVATDIAARGIDISQLSHVINYTLPESPEVYIHRTGRTGRAGSKGVALSLIGPREIGVYYYLKRIYQVALEERTVPSATEIDLRRDERNTGQLVDQILSSTAVEQLEPALKTQATHLLEREDAVQLVQVLLSHFKNRGQKATESAPLGGLLKDVPKPDRVAPGSRQASIEGIASRVATIRGEFRGLPTQSDDQKGSTSAKASSKSEAAPKAEAKETAKTETKKPSKTKRGATKSDDDRETKEGTKSRGASRSRSKVAKEAQETKPRSSRRAKAENNDTTEDSGSSAKSKSTKDRLKDKVRSKMAQRSREPAELSPVDDKDEAKEAAKPERKTAAKSRKSAKDTDKEKLKADESKSKDAAKAKSKSKTKDESKSKSKAAPKSKAKSKGDAAKKDKASDVAARSASNEEETRTPSDSSVGPEQDLDTTRLFLNVGWRDKLTDEGLRDEVAELAGLYPEDILDLDLRQRHCYVIVDQEFTEDVIEAVNGARIGGKRIRIEVAREN